MPLFNPISSSASYKGSLAFNRPQASIYTLELTNGTASGSGAQLTTSTTDGGTSRVRNRTHTNWGVADAAFVFKNYVDTGGGESTSPATVTVSAATLEYPANTFYPILVAGQATFTVAPNQVVITDPIPVIIPAATYFYTRVYFTVPTTGTSPNKVSPGYPTGPAGYGDLLGVDSSTCGDNSFGNGGNGTNQTTTSGTGWINGPAYTYGPVQMLGTPLNGPQVKPQVGIVGDSIVVGLGDYIYGGWPARSLISASIPFINAGRASEAAASGWITTLLRYNRMLSIAACSSVIYEYGTNDLAGTMTFATFKTNALTSMLACGSYGATVWACTITPRTTSTDGWTTAANQTVITGNSNGYNTVRQQVNAYYRAAYSAGAGNSLAYDLAAQGTKFGGIIDIAQAVETTSANTAPTAGVLISGADRWYVPGGAAPTADGVHPNTTTVETALAPIVPVGSFV